jgi:hypothetical protein
MREALNNNPVVQIAVIGLLVVVVGLFFMMNMKKGSSSSSSNSSSAASATPTPSGGTTAGTLPGSTGNSAPSTGATTAPPATAGTVDPQALIPGRGLPAPVVRAWKGGDAIVLLIVRGSGIDDRLVRSSVEQLSGDPGTAVFVAPAEKIARYSRITQGANVTRVPALVVVRPRAVSGAVPQATVSYGFRNTQSVVQAVRDALYNGRDDLSYSPR